MLALRIQFKGAPRAWLARSAARKPTRWRSSTPAAAEAIVELSECVDPSAPFIRSDAASVARTDQTSKLARSGGEIERPQS